MDEIIDGLQQRVLGIDKILRTKNLRPLEQEIFLKMKKRLTGAIQRYTREVFQRQLRIEADKRIERDLPAIAGESLPHGSGLRIPEQSGAVKTYEQKLPATTIRKFHPNINYDMDRQMRLRRLVKEHVSKI